MAQVFIRTTISIVSKKSLQCFIYIYYVWWTLRLIALIVVCVIVMNVAGSLGDHNLALKILVIGGFVQTGTGELQKAIFVWCVKQNCQMTVCFG